MCKRQQFHTWASSRHILYSPKLSWARIKPGGCLPTQSLVAAWLPGLTLDTWTTGSCRALERARERRQEEWLGFEEQEEIYPINSNYWPLTPLTAASLPPHPSFKPPFHVAEAHKPQPLLLGMIKLSFSFTVSHFFLAEKLFTTHVYSTPSAMLRKREGCSIVKNPLWQSKICYVSEGMYYEIFI